MRKKAAASVLTAIAMTTIIGTVAGCGSSTANQNTGTDSVVSDNNDVAEEGASDVAEVTDNVKNTSSTGDGNYSDTITIVWYPNESAEDYDAAREEYGKLICNDSCQVQINRNHCFI